MNAVLPVSRVEVRCEDCAADLGAGAPILVVCRYTGSEGLATGLKPRWDLIDLGARWPSVAVRDPRLKNGARTQDQNVVRGRSVELSCRRCKYTAPRRRQGLVELAEQTAARGETVAYLSLR